MNSRQALFVDMTKPAESIQLATRAPIFSSQDIGWNGLQFMYFQHPANELAEHSTPHHLISIAHAPIQQESRVDGQHFSWLRQKEQIQIVPAHTTAWTQWDRPVDFSILVFSPELIDRVAAESINSHVELLPQFAAEDPLILQISLALKADIEAGYPTGKLFGESAAVMLAARLLHQHSVHSPKQISPKYGLSRHTLRQVLDYIEIHLIQDLSIADLAQVAGMSSYYFIRMFKKSMNITPRQYIIQMRIDRAKELLRSRELSKLARRLRRSLILRFNVALLIKVILLIYSIESPK